MGNRRDKNDSAQCGAGHNSFSLYLHHAIEWETVVEAPVLVAEEVILLNVEVFIVLPQETEHHQARAEGPINTLTTGFVFQRLNILVICRESRDIGRQGLKGATVGQKVESVAIHASLPENNQLDCPRFSRYLSLHGSVEGILKEVSVIDWGSSPKQPVSCVDVVINVPVLFTT